MIHCPNYPKVMKMGSRTAMQISVSNCQNSKTTQSNTTGSTINWNVWRDGFTSTGQIVIVPLHRKKTGNTVRRTIVTVSKEKTPDKKCNP